MSIRNLVVNLVEKVEVTIKAGDTESECIDVGGLRLSGVVIPSNWTSANATLQMSTDDGTTWEDIMKDGLDVQVKYTKKGYYIMDMLDFCAIRYIRLLSGSSTNPVQQVNDVNIKLFVRSL